MADIVVPDHLTFLDIPPDRVLESAMGELEGVIVIGYDKSGEHYFSSTYTKAGVIMWLIEKAKHRLLTE